MDSDRSSSTVVFDPARRRWFRGTGTVAGRMKPMLVSGARQARHVVITAGVRCLSALAVVALGLLTLELPADARQADTYEPLVTARGTRAFDVEYELWYYVNVVFESEVERTADGYGHRYRLTNKGDTSVRVHWRALEESAFAEAVDGVEKLRIGPLDAGTVSDWLVLTSGSPPTVSEQSARMFGSAPSGNESVQFSGPAPAYVPQ